MSTRDTKDGWMEDEPGGGGAGSSPPSGGPGADGSAPGAGPSGMGELFEPGAVFASADPDQELRADPTLGGDAAVERDEYRDALLRVKADFENYKKRIAKDHAATVERAAEKLVSELLPVLDACEAAIAHGAVDVEPVHKSLLEILEKNGLVRMPGEGSPFDPNLHDAVLHEEGDGDEIVVAENLRTGYLWNGRVVRPAMVKVRG